MKKCLINISERATYHLINLIEPPAWEKNPPHWTK